MSSRSQRPSPIREYALWALSPLFAASLASTPLDAQPAPAAISLTPDQNVAAIVSQAPPQSTFRFAPGLYRLAAIHPKDGDRFLGQPGAILNGSEILHMQKDGNLWSASETIAQSDPKYCLPDHPDCFLLSDLFLDNVKQQPAPDLNHLAPGFWYYDAANAKILLGTDPSGHLVELSKLPEAFPGKAAGVIIQDLVIEKYASPPQRGAVGGGGAYALPARWTMQRLEVRWNHGGGLHAGTGTHIQQCNVHDNGQSGIGGSGDDILVEGNHIDANNYAGYRVDWEAGAAKFARTNNLVLRANSVSNNLGNGLWTDIDNIHVLIEKNVITNNAGEGIRHEIGYDAIIRNNFLRGNLSGIVIALSSNVQVYGNVIEVPVGGDFGFRLDVGHRQDSQGRSYQLANVSIHDNIISYLGPKGRSGLIGNADSAPGLTIDGNEYHANGNSAARFRWNNQALRFDQMRQSGIELRGKALPPAASLPDPSH